MSVRSQSCITEPAPVPISPCSGDSSLTSTCCSALALLIWTSFIMPGRFFSEIGEISPAEQREELFGKPADKSAGKPAPVEPKKAQ